MYTLTHFDKRAAAILASVGTFIMGGMIVIAGASSNILPAIICGILLVTISTVVLGYIVWTHVSETLESTPLIGN